MKKKARLPRKIKKLLIKLIARSEFKCEIYLQNEGLLIRKLKL